MLYYRLVNDGGYHTLMSKSNIDFDKYREVLLKYRTELVGDSYQLRRGSMTDDGDISHAPSHLADQGSDTAEQEIMLERLSSSSATLQEIDDALDRIHSGSYGICEECSAEIGEGRLKIKPYASLCIDCRRKKEEEG